MAFLIVAGMAALAAGCGGGNGEQVTDTSSAPKPRPPYSSLNLSMGSVTGSPMNRQLFLDPGNPQFPTSWPVLVGNHTDNMAVKLWRYDFIEPGVTDGTQWYGTLLVRVDNAATGSVVSFFGRGGSYPANAVTLNPTTVFSGDVPEIPANKQPTAFFLYLRQGSPVRLVNPVVTGRTAPYRSFSDTATVTVNVPGLDWPVGGAKLASSQDPQAATVVEVGDAGAVTDIGLGPDGKPVDGIGTAVTITQSERVPTTTRVSPVTSEYDLCFAWQDPSAGVTLTHSVYADPTTSGGPFQTGDVGMTGGGYFVTMLPGAPNVPLGRNTLNWTILRSITDPVWAMGWSADLSAIGPISLGQSGGTLSQPGTGNGLVTAQTRAYLAGLMHPQAQATMFLGAQDRGIQGGKTTAFLMSGQYIPLVARSPRSQIQANFSQLVVAGRSLWYRQNATLLGADVLNSDQTLTDRYGTVLTFSAYLPVGQ